MDTHICREQRSPSSDKALSHYQKHESQLKLRWNSILWTSKMRSTMQMQKIRTLVGSKWMIEEWTFILQKTEGWRQNVECHPFWTFWIKASQKIFSSWCDCSEVSMKWGKCMLQILTNFVWHWHMQNSELKNSQVAVCTQMLSLPFSVKKLIGQFLLALATCPKPCPFGVTRASSPNDCVLQEWCCIAI